MSTMRQATTVSVARRARNLGLMFVAVGTAATASAQGPELSALRERLAAQEALVQEQATLLTQQQQAIADLAARLETVTQRLEALGQRPGDKVPEPPAVAAAPTAPQPPSPAAGAAGTRVNERDGVGDLNAEALTAGSFAGSILLPGTEGVSLAVGGFVKTAAIADSAAEAMGADFLPANLGTTRPDTDGNFAIDSTITRLHMDGRATTQAGAFRGYVEYDLNAANNGSLGFKLRHAYGTWRTSAGTLTAGHTWSTAMDLRILPEGLTEPTVSGAIFQRQAIARWSFPQRGGVTVHLAAEDPSGTDIFTGQTPRVRTTLPDFIGAAELDRGGFHGRVGAAVRRLDLREETSGLQRTATGWGAALSGRVTVFGHDAVAASLAWGDGLGRYVLGLSAGSGAILDPEGQIRTRQSFGGVVWYRHAWSHTLRSTLGAGYAASEVFDEQAGEAFRSSTYAYGNLMWSAARFATLGVEYSFGRRTTKDGSHLDNHRLMLGMQVF